MNKLFTLFVALLPFFAFAQFEDQFEDGDFNSDPTWTGTVENYSVNGENQLQLTDDEASFSYLSSSFLSTTLNNKEWRFYVQLDFSPSGNNNSRIYLSSMTNDLTYSSENSCGAQGYFLQFGESGSGDALRLFRDDTAGEAPVELGAGTEGLLASAFEVTVRVLRDDAGNWQVFMDPNAGENYQLQFIASDDMYDTSENLGLTSKYTVSNSQKFYYDDFYFGNEILDTEIPFVNSIQVLSSTQLQIEFSEALDVSSAENTSNYSVTGLGEPLTVNLSEIDFKTVTLEYSTDFNEGEELTLSITSVSDLAGNPIEDTDLNFTWIQPGIPSFRDVVFNEILADPLPSVGLPEVEFVELYNPSDEAFNLNEWIFVNTETEIELPDYIMGPGTFLLLCDIADEIQMQEYGPVIGLSSFPALANLEDSLTIKDNTGLIIDVLDYTIEWYDIPDTDEGGFTLEQRNPSSSCQSGSSNWGSALTGEGGTPGAQNSIYSEAPDIIPPEIVSVELQSENTVVVLFNESLNSASIVTENFQLDGGLIIESVSISGSSAVVVETDTPFEFAVDYTLTTQNIADCEGNITTEPVEFEFLLGFTPETGDLIINEIMADPDSNYPSPNVEFVELYNKSEFVLEIKGCELSGGVVEQSFTLNPNEYVVLTATTDLDEFNDLENALGIISFPSLTNSGRELELINKDGFQLDFLEYDISWYGDSNKDDGGYSLELINPDDPCSDASNWSASENPTGASEGAENSVFDLTPDTEAPHVTQVLVWSENEIEVFFDEPIDFENSTLETLIDSETGTPDFGVNEVVPNDANSLIITMDSSIGGLHIWKITISGLLDCWGNESAGAMGTFTSVDEYQEGDLILNEVLFNPVTGGSDYVEIYNVSDRNISLQNWFLANIDDGVPSDFALITELPIIIKRQSYMCFTTDKIQVGGQYPFSVSENILELEALPSYNNDEGNVLLIDPEGGVADRFDYSEDFHFELLDDFNGVSLERIRFDEESDNPNNWHSAAGSQNYGTPGYINSQTLSGALSEGDFSLESEIFSPDNDGYQDVLSLSYELETAGYVANIRIYDRLGRELRHWITNELLGAKGVLNYDGLNENGEKLSVGSYIMMIEYFDLDGNVNKEKLVFVVAQFLE